MSVKAICTSVIICFQITGAPGERHCTLLPDQILTVCTPCCLPLLLPACGWWTDLSTVNSFEEPQCATVPATKERQADWLHLASHGIYYCCSL